MVRACVYFIVNLGDWLPVFQVLVDPKNGFVNKEGFLVIQGVVDYLECN